MHDSCRLTFPSSIQALLTAALAALAIQVPAQQQFDELGQRLPVVSEQTAVVVLGDIDGDGDLDMVVGISGQNRLYVNNGQGQFTEATATQLPIDSDFTSALALGDVDGDNDLDLFCGNGGQNRLYLNDGAGTFTDATAGSMPVDNDGTVSAALGDVDGDGDLDMVIGNGSYSSPFPQQNRLYLNDGLGTFTDVTATRMPAGAYRTRAIAIGDVDGDGDLDIVEGWGAGWQNLGGQQLLANDGSGAFIDVTAAQMPNAGYPRSMAVALGDVDGDGDLDLVVGRMNRNISSGYDYGAQNHLYLNSGSGTFTDVTAAQMPTVSDLTHAVVLGDIDGDGDLDMVCGNATSFASVGQNRLCLNDGNGQFLDVTATRMPVDTDTTNTVVLGDVDGDGDLDLVTGNGDSYSSQEQDRLYLNLLRQLDTASPPQVGQNYTFDVYARGGAPHLLDVALPYVSFAAASIPIPPYGTIGIDPSTAVAFSPRFVPQPAGVGSLTIAIPGNAALVGLSIYAQAALVQYPLQPHLTNVTFGDVQ